MTDVNDAAAADAPAVKTAPARGPGLVVAGLVLLALLALVLWLTRPGPAYLQGQIEVDTVRVSSKIGGRVASLEVAEGDAVTEGQLMAVLTTPEMDERARQVQAQVDGATAVANLARAGARDEQIRAARAQLEAAESVAELAAETRARIERLYADGVVPAQRRDEVVTQARAARAQADAAREALRVAQSAVRPEELEAAEAQLRAAQSGLAEVQSLLVESHQFSPVDGSVTVKVVESGELVGPGFPLFVVARLDRPWVVLNIREDLMRAISIGRRISGEVPALGRQTVDFEIYFIAPMADFATWRSARDLGGFDLKTFEVRARPVETIDGLRPGMSVLFAEERLRAGQ
ncbi:MAG: efflux RND transporter periplasmic adaptor subunit [Wenzhouxiangellaceae bacterium]|nr:efflux RND transporter periplasmic adaptor subunit [Wenzhouxiangellaceae bacterium]